MRKFTAQGINQPSSCSGCAALCGAYCNTPRSPLRGFQNPRFFAGVVEPRGDRATRKITRAVFFDRSVVVKSKNTSFRDTLGTGYYLCVPTLIICIGPRGVVMHGVRRLLITGAGGFIGQ